MVRRDREDGFWFRFGFAFAFVHIERERESVVFTSYEISIRTYSLSLYF
jgi:hypothetical protein